MPLCQTGRAATRIAWMCLPLPPPHPPPATPLQLCMIQRLGYGNWEELRVAIRQSHLFKFDWFLKSRQPPELARRCDTLIRLVEKENAELQEQARLKGKAKVRLGIIRMVVIAALVVISHCVLFMHVHAVLVLVLVLVFESHGRIIVVVIEPLVAIRSDSDSWSQL